MIVKIQRSTYSADGEDKMLIIDQPGNICLECPLSDHVAELLNREYKGYFIARIEGPELVITARAPNEDW